MKIGVIKEIKDHENRVALTPLGAEKLIQNSHRILLEENAGTGSGFTDEQYQAVGVEIVSTNVAWGADLVIKVKEPMESEYPFLKNNILFTYLHLAGAPASLTESLIKAKTTAIAYETIENEEGKLPLLAPMSAVAGNMAASIGGYYLAEFNGGKGVQLGSILGERHAKVTVIGDGIVGQHAAMSAYGLGANVTMLGRDKNKFKAFKHAGASLMQFALSSPESIAEHVKESDLVVGAVLSVGAKSKYLVTEDMVKTMQAGSVIVDVSIDQGGCVETSRATSHSDPVFIKHNVTHYCVTNMPGAFPRTSTMALTNATLPYILNLANKGMVALQEDVLFGLGVNTHAGWITFKPVSTDLHKEALFKRFSDISDT